MEFEKCQQPIPTTYSEVHYGNREVSTTLCMDFAVSANAPVGFVLILTRECYHFYFLTGEKLSLSFVKSSLYLLNAWKSAPGIWRFIVIRLNGGDFWYNMHDTLVPRACLLSRCHHCSTVATIIETTQISNFHSVPFSFNPKTYSLQATFDTICNTHFEHGVPRFLSDTSAERAFSTTCVLARVA